MLAVESTIRSSRAFLRALQLFLVLVAGTAKAAVSHDDSSTTLRDYSAELDNHLIRLMLAAEQHRPDVNAHADDQYSNFDVACYGKLGCFERMPVGILPEPPSRVSPKLVLYTQESGPSTPAAVYTYESATAHRENQATRRALSDLRRPLVVIAHGFAGNGNLTWIRELRSIFTASPANVLRDARGRPVRLPANVLVIDWGWGARAGTLYLRAVANSALVGRMAAHICLDVIAAHNISLNSVHFVGFSLGAQLGGFFMEEVFRQTLTPIGRFTALDCAAPLLESNGIYPRKHFTKFLEAIHTSAGLSLITGHVGVRTNFGHVDYYPNGGVYQPGCSVFDLACAHYRAVKYYVEALLDTDYCQYTGLTCGSVNNALRGACKSQPSGRTYHIAMDLPSRTVPPDQQLIVLVRTRQTSPFCARRTERDAASRWWTSATLARLRNDPATSHPPVDH